MSATKLTRGSDILVAIALAAGLATPLLACGGYASVPDGRGGVGGTSQSSGGQAGGGPLGGDSPSGRGGAGGEAGRAGGGGEAGRAGSGGAAATFVPRVAVGGCTGAANPPAGPLLVDALITCPWPMNVTELAAGAGDTGLLLSSDRIVAVDPTGAISAVRIPEASEVSLLSSGNGDAYLQVGRVPGVGLGLYRLDGQGWWFESIDPTVAASPYVRAGRARFGRDGRAYVPYLSEGTLTLAVRAVGGGWTPLLVSAEELLGTFGLGIDLTDRPHVPFLTQAALTSDTRRRVYDWVPGDASARTVFDPVSDVKTWPSVAPTAGGGVAVALSTQTGIHVYYEQDGAAAKELVVPDTPYLEVAGCPLLLPFNGPAEPTPCTDTGDGIVAQALARTTEALWLVYLSRHVDMDLLQLCGPFENTVLCREELKADRSTAEVIVRRLPLDGVTPPGEGVWRTPVSVASYDSVIGFGLESAGSRLLLTTTSPPPRVYGAAHYMVLDETELLAASPLEMQVFTFPGD